MRFSTKLIQPGTSRSPWTSKGSTAGCISLGAGSLQGPYVETVSPFVKQGIGWIPARLLELHNRWRPKKIGIDPGGPAGAIWPSIVALFTAAKIDVDELFHTFAVGELKQAAGGSSPTSRRVASRGRRVGHRRARWPGSRLDAAVADVAGRALGDSWIPDRRTATGPGDAVDDGDDGPSSPAGEAGAEHRKARGAFVLPPEVGIDGRPHARPVAGLSAGKLPAPTANARLRRYYQGVTCPTAPDRTTEAYKRLAELGVTNMCGLIVDTVVERLQPKGVRLSATADADLDVWRTVWQANNLDAEIPVGFEEALKVGRCPMLVWPVLDESGQPVEDGCRGRSKTRTRRSSPTRRGRRDRLAALKVYGDPDDGAEYATVWTSTEVESWCGRSLTASGCVTRSSRAGTRSAWCRCSS